MKEKIKIEKIKFLISILNVFFLLLPSAISHANDGYALKKSLFMQGDITSGKIWNIKAYQVDMQDSNRSAAKICFKKKSNQEECFVAEACMENKLYTFQNVKELKEIQLVRNGSCRNDILFVAEAFGGGSGSYDLLSIWEYNKKEHKFTNILPMIGISEQGEYKIMNIGKSGDSLFIAADYLFGDGETHFEPHRYLIRIYVYDRLLGKYYLKAQFITKKKYKSFNDTESIDVIQHEKRNINRVVIVN